MIDPRKIPEDRMPLIVLSDHSSGIIQWLIKVRTKSKYNHIMMLNRPGVFASQGNVYSEVPLSRYMTDQSRLKFWRIKDLTKDERKLISERINTRLSLPKSKSGYDYLGILGFLIGFRWINSSAKPYCSENVMNILEGIIDLPQHPSPEEIDVIFKKHPRLSVYGRWER